MVRGREVFHFRGARGERSDQNVLVRRSSEEAIKLLNGNGENKPRRQNSAGGAFLGLRDPLVHLTGDQLQTREIVFNVAALADRVRLTEDIDELYLQPAVLLENEGVVGKRLPAHDVVELPFQYGGGNAMGGVEAGTIKAFQFGEAAPRGGDTGRAGFLRACAKITFTI